MNYIIKLLGTFEYASVSDFIKSLFPALRYQHLTLLTVTLSVLSMIVDKVFGMSFLAFIMLVFIMAVELISGIWASKINKQPFSSTRLSRFSFKAACYLVLIAVPYVMSVSFKDHGNHLAAGAFDWLYIFLVIHIVFENVVSILENISVITGKDKTFWIKKIQEKLNFFS